MNAIVLGNGGSGKAAAELLRREGFAVSILDGEDAWPDGTCDLCVTSPGVPLTHPWHVAARAAGVPVISELQLGAERYRAMGGRMLAVTGSKGKSSVVKLVADALGGVPCGNYGKPLCEVASNSQLPTLNSQLKWAVVEVSSFQMETTELPPDTFEAAAVLNLQEDHLDRHGSAEAYHALKRHLLDFAKVKVSGDALADGADDALFAGSYFDNPVLKVNGRCAAALMRAAGLDDAEIRAAFARFVPLPHRMQTGGTFGGVEWIDDSKATSMAALVAGVTMAAARMPDGAPRVRLIAGGLPKGDDPAMALECLAKHVRKAYLIGQCAAALEAAWRDTVPCEMCGTLERAVESAANDAREGDCVLLSPGTASFDQFKSYGERGDRFAEEVRKAEGLECDSEPTKENGR